MLDARISSDLNKIIQNSDFKKKISLEERKAQKEDRFLSRKTDRLHDLRLLSSHWCLWYRSSLRWSILNYFSQWWCSGIRYDLGWKFIIYDQDPSDDVMESQFKLRTRESDQLKTVLELCDLEMHRKISKPDYQKLKTVVKRSIVHKLRSRNFDAGNERIETGAVVTIRRGQRGVERWPEDCYQWKAKGQCSRGDSCSFWHDDNKRAKSTPKSAPHLWTTDRNGWWKYIEKKESERPESMWEVCSTTVQRLHQRWVHETILWLLASSRMSILQNRIGMRIRWKVLVCAQAGWRSIQQKTGGGWWQKCSGCIERCTTIGLRRTSGH